MKYESIQQEQAFKGNILSEVNHEEAGTTYMMSVEYVVVGHQTLFDSFRKQSFLPSARSVALCLQQYYPN